MTTAIALARDRFRLTAGVCARCGEQIAAERLEAVPTALLCIDCQIVIEREAGREAQEIDWSRIAELEENEPAEESQPSFC
jgi:RNA polymerase-binding transcription factor DksA